MSPLIQALNVSGVDNPAALSKAICGLNSLQNLRCACALLSEAILHVAALPSLHYLEVVNEAQQILEVLQTNPSRHYLAGLHRFSTTSTVASCTALLDFVRPNMLQTLLVEGPPGVLTPLASEYGTLFDLISKTCPSLHTLHITQAVRDIQRSPITASTLKPVLTFKNMVSISIASPINITNATIGEMASAWPKLKSLTLINGGRTCGITLECLIPLAMRCPSLNYLAIPLQVSAADNLSTKDIGSNHVGPLDLTELCISGATFEPGVNTVGLYPFLRRLFPNLLEIKPLGINLGFEWTVVILAMSFAKTGLLPSSVGRLSSYGDCVLLSSSRFHARWISPIPSRIGKTSNTYERYNWEGVIC
jgi:hypothetical protein